MGKNLLQAHREWAERPREERFDTLADVYAAVRYRHNHSHAENILLSELQFNAEGKDLLVGGDIPMCVPTNWAFTQLCGLLGAPDNFLRTLPAELVAPVLQHVAQNSPREKMSVLYANEGANLVRCFTTPKYERLWDDDVVQRIMEDTQGTAWHRPPAMDEDTRGPSGFYVGDRNMFLFMVNEDIRFDDGSDKGLARGFFVVNSEVRKEMWHFVTFLYQYVCGNHIVWGAKEVAEFEMRHYGKGMQNKALESFTNFIRNLETVGGYEQKMINAARKIQLGKQPADVIALLSGQAAGLGDKDLFGKKEAAYVVNTVTELGKDPTNLWDVIYGITVASQQNAFTDDRTEWDRRAGSLLNLSVAA